MKNLKKRILSGVVAGALAVSMAVPAFASSNETTINGAYEEIVISVSVPQTGTAQINPYGLPVKLDDAGTNKITGEQIVTKPMLIINNSDSNLKVGASVTTTPKGDLKLVDAAPAADSTAKSAFVYLQMKSTTLADGNKSSAAGNVQGLAAADANPVFEAWKQAYNATTDLVLSGSRAVEKADMVTLAASDVSVSGGTTTVTWQTGSIAAFRLAGQVTADPRDAWTTNDGFTAAVAFSFKPDTTSASLSATATTVANGGTVDLTAALSDTSLTIESVTWTSKTTATATVAAKSGGTVAQGTVTNALASTPGTADADVVIEAAVVASNGVTYTTSITLSCKGVPTT